jgi:hypothetical protein
VNIKIKVSLPILNLGFCDSLCFWKIACMPIARLNNSVVIPNIGEIVRYKTREKIVNNEIKTGIV